MILWILLMVRLRYFFSKVNKFSKFEGLQCSLLCRQFFIQIYNKNNTVAFVWKRLWNTMLRHISMTIATNSIEKWITFFAMTTLTHIFTSFKCKIRLIISKLIDQLNESIYSNSIHPALKMCDKQKIRMTIGLNVKTWNVRDISILADDLWLHTSKSLRFILCGTYYSQKSLHKTLMRKWD